MSFFLTSYLFALALCTAWANVVSAQNATFMDDLLSGLDQLGFTNFTAVVRQVTNDGLLTFSETLSDASSPKTIFVPNNAAFLQPSANFYGYQYQPDSSQFLSTLLLYHLAEGSWLQEDIGMGFNHTIIPTALQGNSMVQLEENEPQVIVSAVTDNGFEIFNQRVTTLAITAFIFEHVTIQVVNAIIGIPGSFSFTVQDFGVDMFQSMMSSGGYTSMNGVTGMTVFVPIDPAFTTDRTEIAAVSPLSLSNNHLIMGQTIRYPEFEAQQYTSVSGMNYTFTQNSTDQSYTVTLNGVTANIIRSDFLTSNGVMHVLDRVLYNVTSPVQDSVQPSSSSAATANSSSATGASSSTPAPNSSGTSSSSSGSPSTTTNDGPTASDIDSSPAGRLGTLPIISITVIAISMLLFPIIGFIAWRSYRKSKQNKRKANGIEVELLRSKPESFEMDPSERLTAYPFTEHLHSRTNSIQTSASRRYVVQNAETESFATFSSGGQYDVYQEKRPIVFPEPVVRRSNSMGLPGLPAGPQISVVPFPQSQSSGSSSLAYQPQATRQAPPVVREPPPIPDEPMADEGAVSQSVSSRQTRPPTYYSMARHKS